MYFFKKVLVLSKENLSNTEKPEYLGEYSSYRYERQNLGQKVIYLRCLSTTKLLLIADGQEKIKFCPTICYGKFYAGKLSIKL